MSFSSDQIHKISKEISSKVSGKTLFDEFSRGRYSTDASVYQIKPIGVILPKDTNDVLNIMDYSQRNSMPPIWPIIMCTNVICFISSFISH